MAKEHVYRLAVAWTGNLRHRHLGLHRLWPRARGAGRGQASPARLVRPRLPRRSCALEPGGAAGGLAVDLPYALVPASLRRRRCGRDRLCRPGRRHHDRAEGGIAKFERVILRPLVTLAPGADVERARALHEQAHQRCYIANSVNFAVEHAPEFASRLAAGWHCCAVVTSIPCLSPVPVAMRMIWMLAGR